MRRILLSTVLMSAIAAPATAVEPVIRMLPTSLSEASAACVDCHESQMPGLVKEWRYSRHFAASVGCFECHGAQPGEPDALDHNGYTVAVIVSPKDCSRCHINEFTQFEASHHANAGMILGSTDNTLGEVVEGPQAAISGCRQCHGSAVKVNADKTLDPTTWPNSGMGRINPDGSKGSCAACHSRHSFDAALARQPENCGKCHLGPDHPQKEIYEESKHGVAYFANIDRMNLHSSSWVLGIDYSAAPTCATCHMAATKDLQTTHDVGDRISWTLRPAVSQMIDEGAVKAGQQARPWQQRRDDMQKVCSNCHTSSYVDNFYIQYDNAVTMYNDKFASPAKLIYDRLRNSGLITEDVDFDDEIEWTYFYLWHHEGRRARMGTAMFAPDYTQWHGFFEVAQRFYNEFLPQTGKILDAARLAGGTKAETADEIGKLVALTLSSESHSWFKGSEPPEVKEARKKAAEEFNKRYGR